MRKYSKIAAAVAVALGSGAALASGPTWTVSLNVAGSSAFRDPFANELSSVICQTGTYVAYVATAGTGAGQLPSPDFRAYTCTVNAISGLPAGTGIIVYYRSEGGSIFGVAGNQTLAGGSGLAVNSLNIGTSGAVNAGPYTVNETVAQLEADTQTGAVQKQQVQLGISDVEPTAFINGNYGSEYSFVPYPAPSVTKLSSVPTIPSIIGQVFAPIVSKTGGSSAFYNSSGFNNTAGLTSQEIATIITGNVSDWGSVPSAVAAGSSGGTITLCRRDQGSGTQVVTSTHFAGQNCSSGGLPYITTTNPGVTATVITNFSTTDVLNCVANNAGAIGFVALQTAAKYTGANATQITVDGIIPSAVNSAQGKYTYYAEAYAVKDASLTGSAATLANKIVTDLQNAQNTPSTTASPSLVAVPGAVNTPFSPVTPFKSGQQIPIAIGSTVGNTCTPLVDQI